MNFLSFLPALLSGGIAKAGAQLVGGNKVQALQTALNATGDFFEASQREKIEKIRADRETTLSSNELELERIRNHKSWWIVGMRPLLLLVCTLGVFYHILIFPIFSGAIAYYLPFEIIDADVSTLVTFSGLALGLGVTRSYDKKNGTERNSLKN